MAATSDKDFYYPVILGTSGSIDSGGDGEKPHKIVIVEECGTQLYRKKESPPTPAGASD